MMSNTHTVNESLDSEQAIPADARLRAGCSAAYMSNASSIPNHRGSDRRMRTEMSLHVLAYNMKRMMTIFGVQPLLQAMRA